MMQLKVRQLRVFEAVATSASFSRAAEQLEMTQPAVSMAVRQIEQALGTALFDPADRRRLSDAGQELLMHARIILAQVRAAEEAKAFYASDGSKETTRGSERARARATTVASCATSLRPRSELLLDQNRCSIRTAARCR